MENEGSITNGPENSLEKRILKATVRTVGDGMLMLPMGNVCSARYVCFALRWNDNQRHPASICAYEKRVWERAYLEGCSIN